QREPQPPLRRLLPARGQGPAGLSRRDRAADGTRYDRDHARRYGVELRLPNDISKGEYNATLSNRLFLMVPGGAMKSFWYRNYKSNAPRIEDISTNFVSGGVFGIDNGRFRPQVNASVSYFKDGLAGTHNLKFGAEIMRDDLDQPFRGFGDPCQCVSVFS